MSRVVKVYSKALFDYAHELNALDKVSKDFEALKEIMSKSPEFQNFLSNPILPKQSFIETLSAIAEKMKFTDVVLKFLIVLVEQRRLRFLTEIVEEFDSLYQTEKGYIVAQVASCIPFNDMQLNSLRSILKEATGKNVLLKKRENPELLGGFVVSLHSFQADFSLKTQLNNLRSELES